MFSHHERDLWNQLCSEIDARYVDGGRWFRDQLEVTHRCWSMSLDTYSITVRHSGGRRSSIPYTRIRVTFAGRRDFRFRLVPQSTAFLPSALRSRLPRFLSRQLWQDYETDDAEFDERYIVQSQDEVGLKRLLASRLLRQRIRRRDVWHMGIERSRGQSLLTVEWREYADDVRQLKQYFGLAALTMNQLAKLELAEERTVRTRIRPELKNFHLPLLLAILGAAAGFMIGYPHSGENIALFQVTVPIGFIVGGVVGFVLHFALRFVLRRSQR